MKEDRRAPMPRGRREVRIRRASCTGRAPQSRAGQPVLGPWPVDTAEFAEVARDHHQPAAAGMAGDEDVAGADDVTAVLEGDLDLAGCAVTRAPAVAGLAPLPARQT